MSEAFPVHLLVYATGVALLSYLANNAYQWLRSKLLVTVQVGANSAINTWLQVYFQDRVGDMRHLTAISSSREPPVRYTISDVGFSERIAYKNKWIFLSMTDPSPNAPNIFLYGRSSDRDKVVSISAFSQENGLIRQWIDEEVYPVYARWNKRITCIRTFDLQARMWVLHSSKSQRDWDSLILPEKLKKDLRSDLTAFLGARDRYAALHVPYRRSYLLHGPPGTGKSSIAQVIAGQLGVDLCVLQLNDPTFSDDHLQRAFGKMDFDQIEGTRSERSAPPRVILIDDFDPTFSEKSKISLGGLLSALDGPMSGVNQILIFTTNHPDHLAKTPALIRSGRIDRTFEFAETRVEQVVTLFEKFYPDASKSDARAFAESQLRAIPKISMADVQGYFLRTPNLGETLRVLTDAKKEE